MTLRIVLAVAALAPTLLLAGCGSEGSELVEAATAGAPAPTGPAAPSPSAAPVAQDPALREAADKAVKSDARSIAILMEASFVDRASYPTALVERRGANGKAAVQVAGGESWESATLSRGTSASVRTNGTSFCLTLTNPGASRPWIYESRAGGIQDALDAACDEADGPEIVSR